MALEQTSFLENSALWPLVGRFQAKPFHAASTWFQSIKPSCSMRSSVSPRHWQRIGLRMGLPSESRTRSESTVGPFKFFLSDVPVCVIATSPSGRTRPLQFKLVRWPLVGRTRLLGRDCPQCTGSRRSSKSRVQHTAHPLRDHWQAAALSACYHRCAGNAGAGVARATGKY